MTKIYDTNVQVSQQTKWSDLDWKYIESHVKRLKCRIFASASRGDGKTVYGLQKLLVKSKYNLLLSIRQTTSLSTGRKSAGIDRQIYLTPEERLNLFDELSRVELSQWIPQPARRIYIPKPDGRKRPLSIPTIKDRIVQGVMKNALEPEWEAYFEPSSYGFRPGKSYNDAAHYVFTVLSKKTKLWVLEADIKGCFDYIDHTFLIERVGKFPYKSVIERWLKGGFYHNEEYGETLVGIVQGGVISPLLCNIALHGLENDLNVVRDSMGYVSDKANLDGRTIARFAYDFVVLCPTKEKAIDTLEVVKKALSYRGLEISEAKTHITHTTQGFDFVGYNFRHHFKTKQGRFVPPSTYENSYPFQIRDQVSTIVSPAEKSIKNITKKISDIFLGHRGKSAQQLIKKLNPVIRGYADSKRCHSVSEAFRRLDNHLFIRQMRWIRRSHPKKNTNWGIKRYFKRHRDMYVNSAWTFHSPEGNKICQKFIWHSKQRRWPPVAASYSPYDISRNEYWKDRKDKIFSSRCISVTSSRDRYLAHGQKSICPVCDQELFRSEDRVQVHHIIPKKLNGSNNFSNLLLLHHDCHRDVHYGTREQEWISYLQEYKSNCDYAKKKDLENIYL